jgi:glucosyl-3-phosphoglycerate phosphatase
MLEDRLVLIRHGQSTWNADGLLQGQADPPLSHEGRREAASLAWLGGRFAPDRVICSDMRRARETAATIGHPQPRIDPRWREIGVGEWAGRKLADLPGGSEPAWRGGPIVGPGGESWDSLSARVTEALGELRAAGGSWLVVCHGGAIRAAVAALTGANPRQMGGPTNASVTIFALGGGAAQLVAYAWTPDGAVPGLQKVSPR